jgi:hypothetical protein
MLLRQSTRRRAQCGTQFITQFLVDKGLKSGRQRSGANYIPSTHDPFGTVLEHESLVSDCC